MITSITLLLLLISADDPVVSSSEHNWSCQVANIRSDLRSKNIDSVVNIVASGAHTDTYYF